MLIFSPYTSTFSTNPKNNSSSNSFNNPPPSNISINSLALYLIRAFSLSKKIIHKKKNGYRTFTPLINPFYYTFLLKNTCSLSFQLAINFLYTQSPILIIFYYIFAIIAIDSVSSIIRTAILI